jgi:hypothetical protein
VPAFEKRQRQFEKVRLTRFEFKFLPALRRWASRTKFFIVSSKRSRLGEDDPGSALGTSYARARNAIRHPPIIFVSSGGAVAAIPVWAILASTLVLFSCIRIMGGKRLKGIEDPSSWR